MKFQNPSLNFFEQTDGHTDGRTDKPIPICSPLFKSSGHKNGLYCLVDYIWYIAFIESYFLRYEHYITDVPKHLSFNTQTVRNGLFKC